MALTCYTQVIALFSCVTTNYYNLDLDVFPWCFHQLSVLIFTCIPFYNKIMFSISDFKTTRFSTPPMAALCPEFSRSGGWRRCICYFAGCRTQRTSASTCSCVTCAATFERGALEHWSIVDWVLGVGYGLLKDLHKKRSRVNIDSWHENGLACNLNRILG